MTSLLIIIAWTTSVLMVYLTTRNLILERQGAAVVEAEPVAEPERAKVIIVPVIRERIVYRPATVMEEAETETEEDDTDLTEETEETTESITHAHADAAEPDMAVAEVVEQHTAQIEHLEAEQAKQAEILKVHKYAISLHDQKIMKIEASIAQARADVEHWKTQLGNLYAVLDIAQDELEQSIIGGTNQSKYQAKVVTLTNKIHMAETRLTKAEIARDNAERQLKDAA